MKPRTLAEAYGTGALVSCGCGGTPAAKERVAGWHIYCKSCGSCTSTRPTRGQAESAWNLAMGKGGVEA